MTEEEIKVWLGLRPDFPRKLRPEILEGMADVPCPPPGPTNEHVNVFSAFLACCPEPPTRMGNLFVADPVRDESGGQAWGDKGCEHRPGRCQHPPGDGCEWCCMTCNTDRHFCPGCGTVIGHLDRSCLDCATRVRDEQRT